MNNTIEKKTIALLVLVTFLVTSIVWNPAHGYGGTESYDFARIFQPQSLPQDELLNLPPEIGNISRMEDGGWRMANNQAPSALRHPPSEFVILIQDAHANPEAQANIKAILEFLTEQYPGMTVGVEGAAGTIHPEYFDLFQKFPEANQAVINDLKQKGELSGAELFAWEQYRATHHEPRSTNHGLRSVEEKKSWPVARGPWTNIEGVENTELYRENLKIYRELLFKQDEIETLLNPLRAELEKQGSRVFSPELLDFLKERSRRKEGKYSPTQPAQDPNFEAYLVYLEKAVQKTLAIDLSDPFEQLRFPNLVKLNKLRAAPKDLDPAGTTREWQKFLEDLGKKLPDEKGLLAALRYFAVSNGFLGSEQPAGDLPFALDRELLPRKLLEYLFFFESRHPFGLPNYKQVLQSFKPVILRSELDAPGLFEEVDALEELLIAKLVVKEDEIKLAGELKTFSLFEKALRLELTRREYGQLIRQDVTPAKLVDQVGLAVSGQRTAHRKETVLNAERYTLNALFQSALDFYRLAGERDRALVENSLALFSGPRAMGHEPHGSSVVRGACPVARVVVLITGGFHTDGIAGILKQRGVAHAVITPRITRTDRGELYRKTMTGENADLSAYFKVANPFQTKQEAVLFKQVLEVAAPALFEKYKMQPTAIAQNVKHAFEINPVLSRAVAVQSSKRELESLRFTPRSAGPVLPQTAAIPAELMMNGATVSESLATEISSGVKAASAIVTFNPKEVLETRIQQDSVKQLIEPASVAIPEPQVPALALPTARSEMREGEADLARVRDNITLKAIQNALRNIAQANPALASETLYVLKMVVPHPELLRPAVVQRAAAALSAAGLAGITGRALPDYIVEFLNRKRLDFRNNQLVAADRAEDEGRPKPPGSGAAELLPKTEPAGFTVDFSEQLPEEGKNGETLRSEMRPASVKPSTSQPTVMVDGRAEMREVLTDRTVIPAGMFDGGPKVASTRGQILDLGQGSTCTNLIAFDPVTGNYWGWHTEKILPPYLEQAALSLAAEGFDLRKTGMLVVGHSPLPRSHFLEKQTGIDISYEQYLAHRQAERDVAVRFFSERFGIDAEDPSGRFQLILPVLDPDPGATDQHITFHVIVDRDTGMIPVFQVMDVQNYRLLEVFRFKEPPPGLSGAEEQKLAVRLLTTVIATYKNEKTLSSQEARGVIAKSLAQFPSAELRRIVQIALEASLFEAQLTEDQLLQLIQKLVRATQHLSHAPSHPSVRAEPAFSDSRRSETRVNADSRETAVRIETAPYQWLEMWGEAGKLHMQMPAVNASPIDLVNHPKPDKTIAARLRVYANIPAAALEDIMKKRPVDPIPGLKKTGRIVFIPKTPKSGAAKDYENWQQVVIDHDTVKTANALGKAAATFVRSRSEMRETGAVATDARSGKELARKFRFFSDAIMLPDLLPQNGLIGERDGELLKRWSPFFGGNTQVEDIDPEFFGRYEGAFLKLLDFLQAQPALENITDRTSEDILAEAFAWPGFQVTVRREKFDYVLDLNGIEIGRVKFDGPSKNLAGQARNAAALLSGHGVSAKADSESSDFITLFWNQQSLARFSVSNLHDFQKALAAYHVKKTAASKPGSRSENRADAPKGIDGQEEFFKGYFGTPSSRTVLGVPHLDTPSSAGEFVRTGLILVPEGEDRDAFMQRTRDERLALARKQFHDAVKIIRNRLKRNKGFIQAESDSDVRAKLNLESIRETLRSIEKKLAGIQETDPQAAIKRRELITQKGIWENGEKGAADKVKDAGKTGAPYQALEVFIESTILEEWLGYMVEERAEAHLRKIRESEAAAVELKALEAEIMQIESKLQEGESKEAELAAVKEKMDELKETIGKGERSKEKWDDWEKKRRKIEDGILAQMVNGNDSFSNILFDRFIPEIRGHLKNAKGEMQAKYFKENLANADKILNAVRQQETEAQETSRVRDEGIPDRTTVLFVGEGNSITPEDFRDRLLPRYGDRLVIVARGAGQIGDESGNPLNHLKVAIGLSANPPLLITMDQESFDRFYGLIQKGKIHEIIIATGDKGKNGEVIANPTEKTKVKYGQETRRQRFLLRGLRKYLKALWPVFPELFRAKFRVNTAPGSLKALSEMAGHLGAEHFGIGLQRTEMMSAEMEGAVLALLDNLSGSLKETPDEPVFGSVAPTASPDEKQAAFARMRSQVIKEMEGWIEDPAVKQLLGHMEEGTEAESVAPILLGTILRKRLFDLRDDKNVTIYENAEEKGIIHDRKADSGFDLYRRKLGRLLVLSQLIIYLTVYAGSPEKRRTQLEVIPPMLRDLGDADYFFEVLLPVAREFTVRRLMSREPVDTENAAAVQERIRGNVLQAEQMINFGTMLETGEAVRDHLDALLQHPRLTVFNFGMNDAQMQELMRTMIIAKLESGFESILAMLEEKKESAGSSLTGTITVLQHMIRSNSEEFLIHNEGADPSRRFFDLLREVAKYAGEAGAAEIQTGINTELENLAAGIRNILAERQDPWIAGLVGRLDPQFAKLIDMVASRFQAYNAEAIAFNRTAKPGEKKTLKSLCFCGEIAQDPAFGLFLRHLEQKYPDVSFSRSMAPGSLPENIFLAQRLESLGPEQLEDLFGIYGHHTEAEARKLAASYIDIPKAVMTDIEERNEDYLKDGAYFTFYSRDIDPLRGTGSIREFAFIKRIATLLSQVPPGPHRQTSLTPLMLSEGEAMTPEDLQKVLPALEGILILRPDEREQTETDFSFVSNVGVLYEEMHKADPEKYSGRLHSENLDDFLKIFGERFAPDLLSPLSSHPTEAELQNRQQQFWEAYYRHANHVFNVSIRLGHMALVELFPPQYSDIKTVRTIQTEMGPLELRTRKRLGWMFERQDGFVVKKVRELMVSVTPALETAVQRNPELLKLTLGEALAGHPEYSSAILDEILRENPKYRTMTVADALGSDAFAMIGLGKILGKQPHLMIDIFQATARPQGGEQVRMCFRIQRTIQKITQGKGPSLEELLAGLPVTVRQDMERSSLDFLAMDGDVSYGVWRLHRWRVFDSILNGWKKMRNIFAASGQRFAIHMQTLRAFEFMERLYDSKEHVLAQAAFVFRKIRLGGGRVAAEDLNVPRLIRWVEDDTKEERQKANAILLKKLNINADQLGSVPSQRISQAFTEILKMQDFASAVGASAPDPRQDLVEFNKALLNKIYPGVVINHKIQALRLASLINGIIRVDYKDTVDQTPPSRDKIAEKVNEILKGKEILDSTREKIIWLCYNHRMLSVHELVTPAEIVGAISGVLRHLTDRNTGAWLPDAQDRLGMLFVMTVSDRIGLTDPDKVVLRMREGPDSPLGVWTAFYLVTSSLVASGRHFGVRKPELESPALPGQEAEKPDAARAEMRSGEEEKWISEEDILKAVQDARQKVATMLPVGGDQAEHLEESVPVLFDPQTVEDALSDYFSDTELGPDPEKVKEQLRGLFSTEDSIKRSFLLYQDAVKPFLVKTVLEEPDTLIRQLIFFHHLRLLNEREDTETVPVVFSPLQGQNSNTPYEVLVGIGENDPGVAYLWFTVLLMNGFFIEDVLTLELKDGKGAALRLLGSFPHSVEDITKAKKNIREELKSIFGPVPIFAPRLRSPLTRKSVQRILNRFVNLYAYKDKYGHHKYQSVPVVKRVGTRAQSMEEPKFIPDAGKEEASILQVITPDRLGLLSLTTGILTFSFRKSMNHMLRFLTNLVPGLSGQISEIGIPIFNIKKIYFDDLRGGMPRMLIYLTNREGRPLSPKQEATVISEMKKWLSMTAVTMEKGKLVEGRSEARILTRDQIMAVALSGPAAFFRAEMRDPKEEDSVGSAAQGISTLIAGILKRLNEEDEIEKSARQEETLNRVAARMQFERSVQEDRSQDESFLGFLERHKNDDSIPGLNPFKALAEYKETIQGAPLDELMGEYFGLAYDYAEVAETNAAAFLSKDPVFLKEKAPNWAGELKRNPLIAVKTFAQLFAERPDVREDEAYKETVVSEGEKILVLMELDRRMADLETARQIQGLFIGLPVTDFPILTSEKRPTPTLTTSVPGSTGWSAMSTGSEKPSGSHPQAQEPTNRERTINLLRHDLSGKIQVLLGAEDSGSVSKEQLKTVLRETLVVFRIFDLEQFRSRGGELFIPEGNDRIFAYRINSVRAQDKRYQTLVYGDRPVAQSFDKSALRRIAEEVGFEKILAFFAEEIQELELLRDELLSVEEPNPEVRFRIRNAGIRIREKTQQLFKQSKMEAEPAAVQPEKKITKILVADDEQNVRQILTLQLESLGYETDSVSDGVEALKKLGSGDYDLAIADVTMPNMDGFELVRTMFKTGQNIPVLLVSGYAQEDFSLEEFKRAGQNVSFLGKPFGKEDLKEAIKRISGRSELRQMEFQGSTLQIKETLLKVGARGGFDIANDWVRSELREPVAFAAETAGSYSVSGVEPYITGGTRSEIRRKARLWIAARLTETLMAQAKEQGISDPQLKKAIAGIVSAIPVTVKLPSALVEQGPVVHLDLSFLTMQDWQELVRSFPVVLANLVSLNAKLMINVDGGRVDLPEIETQILESARANNIKLREGQIQILDSGINRPFASLEKINEGDALMAGSETAFDDIGYHDKIGSRWVADRKAVTDMPLLAAEISTVLYAALDPKVNRFRIQQPSEYGSGALLQAVLTAVQAYLQIRAAA